MRKEIVLALLGRGVKPEVISAQADLVEKAISGVKETGRVEIKDAEPRVHGNRIENCTVNDNCGIQIGEGSGSRRRVSDNVIMGSPGPRSDYGVYYDAAETSSYLLGCIVKTRAGDDPLFPRDPEGRMCIRMHNYAIVPREEYDALLKASGSDPTPRYRAK